MMTIAALAIIAVTLCGFSRIPTGFIPIEDQGYMLATVQLPDGASLPRTQDVLNRVSELAHKTPGVDKVITIAGVSALDNNSSLASGGVAYIILKDWGVRGKAQGLLPMLHQPQPRHERDRGGDRARAAAAADPGHRQRRRRHHADRDARRQLRFPEAAKRGRQRRRQRRHAVEHPDRDCRRSAPTCRNTRSTSIG